MKRQVPDDEESSGTPGVDPYIDWAFGAARASFVVTIDKQEWLPVLLQLSVSPQQFLGSWKALAKISPLYTKPAAGLDKATHCTALVTRKFLDMFASKKSNKLKEQVRRVGLGPPLRAESRAEPAPQTAAE